MNRYLFYLMLIFGECLIVAGFFLFLQQLQPTNLFVLNLVSAMCVFVVIYTGIFDFGPSAKMRSGYAGMGLRWLAATLFSLASTVLIICSIIWGLSFTLCLWLQLLCVFGACSLVVGAKVAADNAARALARVENEREGLRLVSDQLTLMDLAAGGSPIAAHAKAAVERLREEVSYLTVSLRPTSRNLETALLNQLHAMTDSLKDPAIDAEAFRKAVAECVEIIRMRRNQYYEQ